MAELNAKKLETPLADEEVRGLCAGDVVFLSGVVYTARDKAHDRILDYAARGIDLPFSLNGQVLYHCGPLVKKGDAGWEIVSAGPTTSARINKQTPRLLEEFRVRAIIGKGGMDESVLKALKEKGCVYLALTGGAGALAAAKVEEASDVFFLDLSTPEAVWQLKVRELGPLVVAMDARGKTLYNKWRRKDRT